MFNIFKFRIFSYLNVKYTIAVIICILLIFNIILLINRYSSNPTISFEPLRAGENLNYPFKKSKKYLLLIFVKPKCGSCIQYSDSIENLYKNYKQSIDFIGLCMPKFWNTEILNSYGFPFMEADLPLCKLLHLISTPQLILLRDDKVLYATDNRNDIQKEYSKIKNYLEKELTK
ncbi:MAG: hypothetical protein WCK92_08100 [Bacteroidota bacterium]